MGTKKQNRKVIGYLRVSTAEQDVTKNEASILRFANDRNFGHVDFVSEKISGLTSWTKRKLFHVVETFKSGDILIVPELSRLGRSLKDILDVLNRLSEKKVQVFSVKENFKINGEDLHSKVLRTMLALFAEIEHDLISSRTKEGLEAARAKGKLLGRPLGIGRSRLDEHREEIIGLIKNGSQKQFIAKRFKVTSPTLLHWLKRHELNHIKPQP